MEATEYTLTQSAENIIGDVIVVCSWKKIDTFSFDAWEWYHQVFAYNRIRPVDANGSDVNDNPHNEAGYKDTFDYKTARPTAGTSAAERLAVPPGSLTSWKSTRRPSTCL